mgnify:CR=1 FL=1
MWSIWKKELKKIGKSNPIDQLLQFLVIVFFLKKILNVAILADGRKFKLRVSDLSWLPIWLLMSGFLCLLGNCVFTNLKVLIQFLEAYFEAILYFWANFRCLTQFALFEPISFCLTNFFFLSEFDILEQFELYQLIS